MGEEKLDNAVYYVRGLYDFADMARAKRERTTERWAKGIADRSRRASTGPGGTQTQYADSLRAGARVQQKHWIGVTPMEAELTIGGRAVPRPGAGRPRRERAGRARERLLQRLGPVQPRPLPHRLRRRRRRARASATSSRSATRSRPSARATTAATQEPLHHRQRRPDVRARRAAGRAAGDPPLAGPERQHRPLLDLPLDVHAGLGPLRHGLAGDPPAARRAPVARHGPARDRAAAARGPDARSRAATSGSARRLRRSARRSGAAAATRPRSPSRTSTSSTTCASARRSRPARRSRRVTLDGDRVRRPTVRETNRGVEVTVPRRRGRRNVVVVTTG